MEKKNDPNMKELDMDQLEAVSGGTDDEQPTGENEELSGVPESRAHSRHK